MPLPMDAEETTSSLSQHRSWIVKEMFTELRLVEDWSIARAITAAEWSLRLPLRRCGITNGVRGGMRSTPTDGRRRSGKAFAKRMWTAWSMKYAPANEWRARNPQHECDT